MKKTKIFIAGHNGMVGSALFRLLKKNKNYKIIIKEKKELDLTNQSKVDKFFKHEKIDQVYLAAAKVGGIYANNTYPADFIYENIMIQSNIIHASYLNKIKKLLFLGSTCIYPKYANQPVKETDLLTGKLEPTNEAYAIAKIAGIKMCESYNRQYGKSHGLDYRSIIPTNLYGPGDNYHVENSHVIPSLLMRFHEAKKNKIKSVTIWGTGKPIRDFLYIDDMAQASIFVMNLKKKFYMKHTNKMCSHINVGSGKGISINELANLIKKVVNYKGNINFDKTKLDGAMVKITDNRLIKKIGFNPSTKLENGLIKTYKSMREDNLFG